jgi:hypothetical protein
MKHNYSDDKRCCTEEPKCEVCTAADKVIASNGKKEIPVENGKVAAFRGNGNYDRLPPEDWDYEGKGDWPEFRTDCPYALSPYWKGFVVCFVPNDANFEQHPPIFGESFRILVWVNHLA